MSFLMVIVDFPVCSPPISGGRCMVLAHFQVPAMLLYCAISGGGLSAGAPAGDFLASDFSCARANGDPMANAKVASEAISFTRFCLRQCIAILLLVENVISTQTTN